MLAELQANNPQALAHTSLRILTRVHAHTHARGQLNTSADPHTGQRAAEATGAQQPVSISTDQIILFFLSFPLTDFIY